MAAVGARADRGVARIGYATRRYARDRTRPARYQLARSIALYRYRVAVRRSADLDSRIRLMATPFPNEVWSVPLDRISLHTRSLTTFRAQPHAIFHVADGQWDRDDVCPVAPIFEPASRDMPRSDAYSTVRAIVIEGGDVRDTPAYQDAIETVRRGEEFRRMRDETSVHAYFADKASMAASMRSHGYRTLADLGVRGDVEAQLYVTRSGELCHMAAAHHRLLTARALEIDRVPAVIRGAHPGWIRHAVETFRAEPHDAVPLALAAEIDVRRWSSEGEDE